MFRGGSRSGFQALEYEGIQSPVGRKDKDKRPTGYLGREIYGIEGFRGLWRRVHRPPLEEGKNLYDVGVIQAYYGSRSIFLMYDPEANRDLMEMGYCHVCESQTRQEMSDSDREPHVIILAAISAVVMTGCKPYIPPEEVVVTSDGAPSPEPKRRGRRKRALSPPVTLTPEQREAERARLLAVYERDFGSKPQVNGQTPIEREIDAIEASQSASVDGITAGEQNGSGHTTGDSDIPPGDILGDAVEGDVPPVDCDEVI
jgi:hypothetical protein